MGDHSYGVRAAFHSLFLFLLVILLRLGTSGEAVLNLTTSYSCKHKQINRRDCLSTVPAKADALGASARVGLNDRRRPLYQSILHILTPFCDHGNPPAPDSPNPQVAGLKAQTVRSGTVSYDAAWQWVICPQQKTAMFT